MTDEEILKKYEVKIKQRVNEIAEEYEFTDPEKVSFLAQVYRKNFIIGFRKGEAKRKIEIVKKMLSKNHSISDISDLTGLSIEEIERLKT